MINKNYRTIYIIYYFIYIIILYILKFSHSYYEKYQEIDDVLFNNLIQNIKMM